MMDMALAVNIGQHGDQQAWQRLREPPPASGKRDVGRIKRLARRRRAQRLGRKG